MPRKQRGWGTQGRGFAFGKSPTVIKGLRSGAAGSYPANRQFGTMVSRSIIEQWDMNSDWVKWRKGYEYYMQAAWDELMFENPAFGTKNRLDPEYGTDEPLVRAVLDTVLYQGTGFEVNTRFYGWEFPTAEAGSNTHYVAKREPEAGIDLGSVTEVWNDQLKYPDQKKYREIWIKGAPGADARALLTMEGERLWDKETEATLKTVLDQNQKPAIYRGKTFPSDTSRETFDLQATKIRMALRLDSIVDTEDTPTPPGGYVVSQGLDRFTPTMPKLSPTEIELDPRQLIGQIIYVPQFFIEKSVDDLVAMVWGDADEYMGTSILDVIPNTEIYCLEPDSQTLPVSLYDVATLPNIFTSPSATIQVTGSYIFSKKQYQRFYDPIRVTAADLEEVASTLSYSILPFTIQSASVNNGVLEIESVPFSSEIRVHPELTAESYLIFTDNSFCKYSQSKNLDGSDKEGWTSMYVDVQPWQDEVFTIGALEPAATYTCSCPNHAHAILAAPQATEDLGTRRQNRQKRYPLPSVQGLDEWQGLGVEQYSGKFASWETEEHRLGLKLCKHAIAARFIQKIKLIEPSQYPSVEARKEFEGKLQKEINEFGYEFKLSSRNRLTSFSEIIFALAQGLNLDGIETAYVLFQSTR